MSQSKLDILGMEGVISNYKRGRHTVHQKHCILVFSNINSRKDANTFQKVRNYKNPFPH